MAHNYDNVDLRININYMNTCSSENLYDWKHICVFHHSDIMSPISVFYCHMVALCILLILIMNIQSRSCSLIQ